MDLKAAREVVGVSQRELAQRTGISQATLSRVEGGERDLTQPEATLVEIALGGAGVQDEADFQPEPEVPPREHVPRPGVRRAFVCSKCRRRRFLGDEPAGFVPDCLEHGPMVRQANHSYMGQSTEPPPESGWPRALDGAVRGRA